MVEMKPMMIISIFGAYAQGKFELAKKLDLVVAGRVDQFQFLR